MALLRETPIWRNLAKLSEQHNDLKKKLQLEKSILINDVLGLRSLFDSVKWSQEDGVYSKKSYDDIEIPKNLPIMYRKTLDEELCTPFNSKQGRKMFQEGVQKEFMNIYYVLSPQFHTQSDPNFCGIGTLVMALNALEVDPRRIWKYPWRYFDEEMLNSCTPLEKIKAQGINFDGMICIGRMNGIDIEAVKATSLLTLEDFRIDIKKACSSFSEVIMLHYSRGYFNQTGTGHYTTVGGYNESEDQILLLDTARFKYPPHWVKLSDMWKAMKEIEKASNGYTENTPRGYMRIRKGSAQASTNLLQVRLSNQLKLDLSDNELLKICNEWRKWLSTYQIQSSHTKDDLIKILFDQMLFLLTQILTKCDTRLSEGLIDFINRNDVTKSYLYNGFMKLADVTNKHMHFNKTSLDNDEICKFITSWVLNWSYRENTELNLKLKELIYNDIKYCDENNYVNLCLLNNLCVHVDHEHHYKQKPLYFD